MLSAKNERIFSTHYYYLIHKFQEPLLYLYQTLSWGKGETRGWFLLLLVKLWTVFVEFDVTVWHGSLFIQIVVTQGLSFIHIVEVELYFGLLIALADWWWFPDSAANIKTNE